ncbi:MAG: SusC/RagA family TonB-linked outer membrane protein [Gemmatimonadaceae bacterium]
MTNRVRKFFVLCIGVAGVMLLGASTSLAQEGVIAGHVVDATTNTPVVSAQVQVVGTTRGATTADDGRFRIATMRPGVYQVRVLRIGYQAVTQTVTLNGTETISLEYALAPVAVTLDQVVTLATGETTRKREQGNVIGTLTPEPSQLVSAGNMSQLLTGRVPGVDIASPGGTIGSGARFRIRGASSLSLSNDPLIVVDGIRVDNDAASTTIGVGGQRPSRFNDINQEDIEKIDILKGPAASALYGTAAANGVIQITTKRGRSGPTRFSVFGESGSIRNVTSFPRNFAWVGTNTAGARVTNCTLDQQTRVNSAGVPLCTANPDSLVSFSPLAQYSPFIDGQRGAYGASAVGGNDRISYYIGGNYDRQQGVFTANVDQRAGGRANLSAQLTDNWNLQFGTNYLADHLRLPQNDNDVLGIVSAGVLGNAFDDSVPGQPCTLGGAVVVCAHGYLNGQTPQQLEAVWQTRQDIQRFQNSITSNYQPLHWLKANGTIGLDYLGRWDNELIPPASVFFGSLPDGQRRSNPYSIYTYTAQGNLSGTWAPLTDLTTTTTVGTQFTKALVRGTEAFGAKLLGGTSSLAGTTARFSVNEVSTDNKTLGYFGSEELGWRDRVFLNAALRNDKNSAFGQNFGSITYPSFGASWVISEEDFFPKTNVLSSLRLRAADGRSGRQPNFRDAITFFNATTVTVNSADVPGIAIGGTGNVALRPERSNEAEFGFDLGLIGQRVNFEYTHYNKKTDDLLIAVPLAPSLGLSNSQFQNLGSVRNVGNEYSLDANVINTRPVAFNFLISASNNLNTLLSLGNIPGTDTKVPPIIVNTQQKHVVGVALGSYWQRPYVYSDANGDGIVERSEIKLGDTAVYLGNILPKREYSFSPTMTLFNVLKVSALIDHKGGFKLFDNTRRFHCSFGTCQEAYDKTQPLADQAAAIAIALGTDAGYIENAAFTKLRQLSFTLLAPDHLARTFRVQNLDFTVAGQNLHTWTKYKGFDPELNAVDGANFSTQDFLTLPPSRTWTARIDVTF